MSERRPGRRLAVVLAIVTVVLLGGCTTVLDDPATGGVESTAAPSTETDTETSSAKAGTLTVHFINVGQSSSTLLVGPNGTTVLVDSGDFRDRGEHVLDYLARHDVDRIDALVTTHADADHIGGHAEIIEHYETEAGGVGAVYDPGIAASTRTYERYLDAVERYDVPLYRTEAGDTIPLGSTTARVLAPPRPFLEDGHRNENSIVLRVGFGDTSFLLTGDGESAAERYLVTTYGSALDATVLSAGHHGSRTSTDDALLDAVDPAAVVVSSAYDSQYGHPHVETLRRLADRSIPTYWTATHGDLVFRSDGTDVAVYGQRRATADPLRLRRASPVPPGSTEPAVRLGTVRGDSVVENATTARATPIADGGRSVTPNAGSGASLTVAEIHADAAGDERANLNDEYVTLRNDDETPLELGGWTVRDEAGHVYAFPDEFTLAPGATVTVHTGRGTNTETDLYWGRDAPVWNNDGDTVRVRAPDGTLVVEEASA